MKTSEFIYDLPDKSIAIHPPAMRGSSRLLILNKETGEIKDDLYCHAAQYFERGDVLVVNNTKVFPARLKVRTKSGESRELLLLEKHKGLFNPHRAEVIYKGHIVPGQTLIFGTAEIVVESTGRGGTAIITCENDLYKLALDAGEVPLPPYLHRQADKYDKNRYQTVFAEKVGSVAAPTASLNMTDAILESIKSKGVTVAELTLHVGIGTFLPIRTEEITSHIMHSEYFNIPAQTVNQILSAKEQGNKIIALGTTVTRTLEYVSDQIVSGNTVESIDGEADIFIYPGYRFKLVDKMLTNFHAPKSTVLMMAAAFAGWEKLKPAYDYAIGSGYKLLSYGDSMLIG